MPDAAADRHDLEASPTRPSDDGQGPALPGFHPAVSRWFYERFEAPTPAQEAGWPAIRSGRHALISAPTGSGKTLAAFLSALDDLFREGLAAAEAAAGGSDASEAADGGEAAALGGLPDETRVVYVSPLKALSADIHRNLAEPRKGIREAARSLGLPEVRITAALRSGDTPQSERRAMVRTPPHILVTTPESLHILLTAERSRDFLRTVRTVIVDEIHAVLGSRRGSHLALTLERLEHAAGRPLQRIGLSATQNPIEEVARFLVGTERVDADGRADCEVVDAGHLRELDLGLEVPDSPLEAVMSHEAWDEVYDRIAELVAAHRTTLVFVNTRRMAERVAARLAERCGEESVAAHHGSLSRESRLDAERRLKDGSLRVLVATASLELGIDVGHVDLVCQLGSPNRIAAFLQRVGRSGHTLAGTPRGRLFPLTRDDLVECAALLRAARRGELDRVVPLRKPLDVLAQSIVAEAAAEDWDEEALFATLRRAWPYRDLGRDEFDDVLHMLSRGLRTRRGRKGAHLHRDEVNGRVRGRRGARLAAITSGGAIPDNADFRVLLEPGGTFIGTLNEDFAIESSRGDIFQLGNASWQIVKVETGVVRVADAHGQPPTIPFWLGEAPARSDVLSAAVSELRRDVCERLGDVVVRDAGDGAPEEVAADEATPGANGAGGPTPAGPAPTAGADGEPADGGPDDGGPDDGLRREEAARWAADELGLPGPAAFQLVRHLAETKRTLGAVPTQETLVVERFFDEAGGMQLVLHSPFGSRVNRAWGLALRKRFCQSFNFELQAAATEDGILLSLGPQHSFPLDDVFRYLSPETAEEVLVQALLDSPLFQTRWRWNATIALAVLRWRGGGKTPPQIQRMEAEDLLAAVFPDAAACFENIEGGKREIPRHPLVDQTIRDCLTEAMDLPRLAEILGRIRAGELRLVARDVPEPSTLTHEILTARPYAFLDDAPAEERRALAVQTRRALDPSAARELGALDAEAIRRVRREAWPDPRDADELHDALLVSGFLTGAEVERGGEPRAGDAGSAEARAWDGWARELASAGRATLVALPAGAGAAARAPRVWVATERLAELRAAFPDAPLEADPAVEAPARDGEPPSREEAVRELLRGRIEVVGPVTAERLGASLGLPARDAGAALLALEGEGAVLRGAFSPGLPAEETEWCDRRLLARIHRLTLSRLRAEIQPVSASDYMRFLSGWQRVEPERQAAGAEGLAAVLEQLAGCELPAAAWEPDVLSARCRDYDPGHLDALCLSGRVTWARLTPPDSPEPGAFSSGPLRSSPIAVGTREHVEDWLRLAPPAPADGLSTQARRVLEALEDRGASFFDDLASATGLMPTRVERALGELAGRGAVTSDGFSGLRALLTPSGRRRPLGGATGRPRGRQAPYGVETAGRWSVVRRPEGDGGASPRFRPGPKTEAAARALLRRYGVVFRRLLEREGLAPPWRELVRVYRRMEARGEVRGGRFVSGFSGEQFALPEAVGALRAARRAERPGRLRSLSAADPLNLTGILTPGERVPAVASNRVVFRDGVPVAAREAGEIRLLVREEIDRREVERALVRPVPPALRWYVGRAG